MNLPKDIFYIGVDDREIDLFEGMYQVPDGMAYNSYVILDEKIAVLDTVERRFGKEWLSKLEAVLDGRRPDYLIVQHMEPDHSANIALFMQTYPEAVLVASAAAFPMLQNFYGVSYPDRRKAVKDGETLSLGSHTLRFVTAPMVHWPEVVMTYDESAKTLFSADAFGKFGASDAEDDEGWSCEARRYYFGIVGKYGVQVQAVLKKLANVELNAILPLHGPQLLEDLGYYLNLHNIWSSYGVETEGVAIFYTSVYGNTKQAAELLAQTLREKGCPKVAISDLARSDMAECVEDAFRYGRIALATTTYNNDVFPFMREFLQHLTERGWKNRKIGLIENGSWAPAAAKTMKALLEPCKNTSYCETVVTLKSGLSEAGKAAIAKLAEELLA